MRIQVALVDDERSAREYISRMHLWHEDEFCLAICASGAQELLRELEDTAIEILLMDVSMPDVDGVALSAHIRQTYPQIDIIAISNYDDYDYVRQILRNGAKDYLLKHRLTEDVLRSSLQRLTEQRLRPSGESRNSYRQQLARFLSGAVSWPFPTDGSITVPCFGFAPTLNNLTAEQRESVTLGIEKAMEAESDENVRCTACHYMDDLFLLLLRFYDKNSRAAMEQKAHYLCENAKGHVKRAFSHPILLEVGPILLDQTTLPGYILHRVGQERQRRPGALPAVAAEQKAFLMAMIGQNETEAAQKTARSMLASVDRENSPVRFFLLRDILETAGNCEMEKRYALPSESELLEWLGSQTWQQVSECVCRIIGELTESRSQETAGGHSSVVRDAVNILNREYGKQLTLAQVAVRVGVSEAHLSRLFKKELRSSFNRYLNDLRMEHAKEMLLRGATLKEAAADTGYVQYTHFLRVFKQSVGITPKDYIRKIKNR